MKENEKKQLGIRIKALREAEGLTQEQLAEACDVSWRTISNLERFQSTPDLKLIISLSRFFSLSIDELLKLPSATSNKKASLRQDKEAIMLRKIQACDDKLFNFLFELLSTTLKHFPYMK